MPGAPNRHVFQTANGPVMAGPVNDTEWIGMDAQDNYHIFYMLDPTQTAEKVAARCRRESRHDVRKVCSPDLTWKKQAVLPVWKYAADGERFEDPDFAKHFLGRNPQFLCHNDRGAVSGRFLRVNTEARGDGTIRGKKAGK